MKTKFLYLLIACSFATSVFSQSNLNNYKYIIVPNKYDFLKEADQYQLNSLTEFLFNKYGFLALMEGSDYPADLIKNRCLALKSNLVKDNSMFKTKLVIELKSCNDQVVYTSEVGESREKEFQRAYTEALRNTFESIEALNYKYAPSATNTNAEVSQDVETKNEVSKEIQQLKEEIQNLKKEKETVVVEKAEPKVEAVPQVPVKETSIEKVENINKPAIKEVPSGVLYAQAIENGFQLVDSTPKVVYKIKKTGIVDVYLVENKNATLYKKGVNWILEYYENNVLKQDVLDIKF